MEPPLKPQESDCCNSGCNPCILDVYDIQLKKYNEYLRNINRLESRDCKIINCIDLTSYTNFKLTEQKQLSESVFLLKFKYNDSKEKSPNSLKYKSGQYFLLRAKDCNGEFTRAYTPIPIENDDDLAFTILVRLYENGRMSKILQKLQVGSSTAWRGPYGDFSLNYNYKYVFFIAQGTGIAPIFSVIHELVNNEECESFIKLFFCCRSCDDIFLREKLYEYGSYWNFTYEVFLSNNSNIVNKYNETIHENKLSYVNISNYVSNKSGNLQAIVCGSDKFGETIKKYLENSGIESNDIYVF